MRDASRPSVLTALHYRWLALAMLVLAIYGSLMPFHYRPRTLDDALAAFRGIAFYDPTHLGARGDWIVSVVLFLALSFLFMAALGVDRRGLMPLIVAPAVVVLCALLSVAIEFTQLYFPPRTVSLNDITVETLGGLAGTLLWLIAGQRITQWVRRVTAPTDLAGLARRLFPGYMAFLLIVLLMPFDLIIAPAELAVKYHEGKILLLPLQSYATAGGVAVCVKLAANMACFFPVGFLKALGRPGRPDFQSGLPLAGRTSAGLEIRPTTMLWVLLFGLGCTSLVELLQLFVYSRVCDVTDILTGTLAVVLGWRAHGLFSGARRSAMARSTASPFAIAPASGRRRAIVGTLLLAWLGGVLYLNWSPFDFTTDPAKFGEGPEELPVWGIRRMTWLPLVDYYWGSKYQLLDQFLKKTVSFGPLGVLCAFASPRIYRPGAVPATVSIAFALAVAIEAGRYFLPSHSASVTDVGLQCFGAWLGFTLTQHVRALLWAESLFGQAALR